MGEKVGIGGNLGSDAVVLAPGAKVMGCWFGAGLGDVTIGIWVISEAKSELSSLGMEVVVMVDRFDVLPHGKVGKGVGSHVFNSFSVEGENPGWLCLLTFQAP